MQAPRGTRSGRMRMTWRLCVAGALLLAGAGIALGWYYTAGVFRTARFDAAYWRAPLSYPGDPECHRGRMVSDLRERLLLPGLTTAQVRRLLGPPDAMPDGEWLYHLGACRMGAQGAPRFDVLVLYFDPQARLAHVNLSFQ